jgi:hypothetical protein
MSIPAEDDGQLSTARRKRKSGRGKKDSKDVRIWGGDTDDNLLENEEDLLQHTIVENT